MSRKFNEQRVLKIALIGGYSESIVRFRLDLIKTLTGLGHEVIAMAGDRSDWVTKNVEEANATFEEYPLQRSGRNPLSDLQTLVFLYKWFRQNKIDVVILYTSKPVIWGGIAARMAGVLQCFPLITGLGEQFGSNSIAQKLQSKLLEFLYKVALKRAKRVIFQNEDDRDTFVDKGITRESKTYRVYGSGVRLQEYPLTALPDGPPVFLTIARLLASKGIKEFYEAAKLVKIDYPNAIFRVIGIEQPGARGVPVEQLREWHAAGVIDFQGSVEHTAKSIAECHVFVLASYYGEGVPRTLLEALSVGRPIITTNNVGCRDTVVEGINGTLIEPRSSKALAQGMSEMLSQTGNWPRMARSSRKLAEEQFDVDLVNQRMVDIMQISGT